jgi:toxin ParE1/3/4
VAHYSLTQAAAKDISDIFIAGLAMFGLDQADKYHEGLTATFAFLADYPRAARVRFEITPPVRAYRYKSHMIIYEIDDDDAVIILRVRHGHEDWLPHTGPD